MARNVCCIIVLAWMWTSPPASTEEQAPPRPSGITFHEDTLYRSDGRGDNWCLTWAADGSQITSMCDGNWLGGGTFYHNRLYRVEGGPDGFSREALEGYPDFIGSRWSWFGYGITSVDGVLYSVISKTPLTRWSGPFRGIKLLRSDDNGATWGRVDREGKVRIMERDDPRWNEVNPEEMFFLEEQGMRRGDDDWKAPAVQLEKTHIVYTRDSAGQARLHINGEEAATAEIPGSLAPWDDGLRLWLANEATGDRPWLGTFHHVALYSRVLAAGEIAGHHAAGAPQHLDALLALYNFDAGEGILIRDISGVEPALDLHIAEAETVAWREEGLEVLRSAVIATETPSAWLAAALQDSNAFTLEAWVTPADSFQAGPARMVSMSQDHWNRNFTLGQSGNSYEMRFRTSETSAQGEPSLQTPVSFEAYPFSFLDFVQYGQDNALAKDDYLYMYAPEGAQAHQLQLARAPKEQLGVRAAWEYFQRHENGAAVWTSDIEARGVVHEFPETSADGRYFGWYSWLPSVVWNEALGLYIMVNGGTYGGQQMSAEDSDYFDAWMHTETGSLGFWYAENAWGPWTEIFHTDYWIVDDPGNRTYQPKLSPKWISDDGKEMVLIWSDAMRDAQGRSHTTNYVWNQMRISIEME